MYPFSSFQGQNTIFFYVCLSIHLFLVCLIITAQTRDQFHQTWICGHILTESRYVFFHLSLVIDKIKIKISRRVVIKYLISQN